MKAILYFDPSCQWTWITSRWLKEVTEETGAELFYRPFSLAIQNEQYTESKPGAPFSIQVLRIVVALAENEDDQVVGRFYKEFGRRYHVENSRDIDLKAVLRSCDIPAEYSEAAQEIELDEHIIKAMRKARKLASKDVGSPIIVIEKEENSYGFFGPVLTELPSKEQGLKVWESLQNLFETEAFSEVKTKRQSGPQVETTKRAL